MVGAVTGTAGLDAGAIGKARLAESFDTFLALLTTQLKNQDPLSPMDSNQFTQQIVQMTGVEQQLLTNDLLKKLVANTGSGVSTAVSLIGKEVRAATTEAQLTGGKAEWIYKLDRAADDVRLEVLDSKGRIVRTIAPTDKKAGDHNLTWDGKDQGGQPMPEGVYALRVVAKDSQGTPVPASVFIRGLVTGVEQANGETLITVNGSRVPWNYITQIHLPPATAAAGSPTDSNNNPDGTTPSPPAA
jgi:flagellar basal-body rod modification protein FlgD